MAENSLSKLQNKVIKLEKENQKLKEANYDFSQENFKLRKKIKEFEENMDKKIEEKAKEITNKLYKQIIIENEQLKQENEKLKRLLNNTSENSGIPISKTPIGNNKRIPNSREKSDKSKGGQLGHKKHKLEIFDNELNKKILKEPVINWDDTVVIINGKQSCLRFYGTQNLAYFKAHLKKNKERIDEDNILEYLLKDCVVVHDHNIVNYNNDYDFTNAECCVHLIRDLKKLNEVLPRDWINELIELLVTANNKRNDYINQSIEFFNQEVTDKIVIDYDAIINKGREI